ncbi:sigma-70 family RNA polymerase sigma factor [Micromonospora sp. NPDC023644]|uniref:RNA polymerase sigma factor n=1 Tax=Micromonospora sp. NPDC023644 TaxID=3154321 RepID=UPI0033CC5FC5
MTVEEAPRSRRSDVVGAVGIFNVALVGLAGLYAATSSLWLTGIGGAVAAVLAGAYLLSGRHDPAAAMVAETGLAGIAPSALDTMPADGEGSAQLMEEADDERADDGRKDFAEFFRAEYPRLVYTVMRLGATRAEAEDVVGDVLTRLCVRWESIEDPVPYAYRSVVNGYRSSLRSAGRTVSLDAIGARLPGVDGLDIGQRERRILEAVGRLPAAQRVVIALHYAGLSNAEIAEETGSVAQTVRSNLRHARERLKALLIADDLL